LSVRDFFTPTRPGKSIATRGTIPHTGDPRFPHAHQNVLVHQSRAMAAESMFESFLVGERAQSR